MDLFTRFIITLAIAAVGGMLFYKLRFPAGPLVGALVATAIYNVALGNAFFYGDLRTVIQIMAGAMIGSKISKSDVMQLKKLIAPTAILLVAMVCLNLGCGFAMYIFSDLDIATALFATSPGGMTDMAIISADLGANSAYVALLQLVRMLIILILLPPMFKKIIGNMHKKENSTEMGNGGENIPDIPHKVKRDKAKIGEILAIYICAAAGGIILWQLKVTAGALIGGMVASAAYGVLVKPVYLPQKIRIGMQIFSGAFLGMRMDKQSMMALPGLIVPVIIMLIGVVVLSFGVSFIMNKVTKLDYATCMLASTPGGLQEMSLLSEELDADTTKIAIMQTTRLFTVILLFPTMLSIITNAVKAMG